MAFYFSLAVVAVEANFHFHYFNRLLTHNFLEEIVAIECLPRVSSHLEYSILAK